MDGIFRHQYVRELMSLDLDGADFAIAGSGPIFARGWIDDPGDLDVVARGSAWTAAARLGEVEPAPYPNVRRVFLFGGDVEVLDGWFPECWSADRLIDDADRIDGVRFVQLAVVVATKEMLGRPKDRAHLRIVGDRLAQRRYPAEMA